MHIPVLLQESIDGLNLSSQSNCIDATVGHGGHTQAMLDRIAPTGQVIGFDRDRTSLFLAVERLKEYKDRFVPIHDSFASLTEHRHEIEEHGPIHAILADVGLSSLQLDTPERGFSFRYDAPLDMRFDQTRGETAAELIQSASEEQLSRILYEYADERHARRIAHALVTRRRENPIQTTNDLIACVQSVLGKGRVGKVHPATRTFQALRIAVNQELDHIQAFLPQAIDVLASGGRLAVITFHSIEDRLVKRFFQDQAKDCVCPPEFPECRCDHRATIRLVTRKPIMPSSEEIKNNPRSRSAQLRIIQKL